LIAPAALCYGIQKRTHLASILQHVVIDFAELSAAPAFDAFKYLNPCSRKSFSAFDRRIIHNALKDDPGVETQSVEVEGTNKKAILLRPKH
jgi:predicted RNA-binding protein Jag